MTVIAMGCCRRWKYIWVDQAGEWRKKPSSSSTCLTLQPAFSTSHLHKHVCLLTFAWTLSRGRRSPGALLEVMGWSPGAGVLGTHAQYCSFYTLILLISSPALCCCPAWQYMTQLFYREPLSFVITVTLCHSIMYCIVWCCISTLFHFQHR